MFDPSMPTQQIPGVDVPLPRPSPSQQNSPASSEDARGEAATASTAVTAASADQAATVALLPRPDLPVLAEEDLRLLAMGMRVQKQTREGGAGSGLAVVDVRADPGTVLELLTAYDDYASMIDTVRSAKIFGPRRGPTVKAEFTMSRFQLHVRVLMTQLAGKRGGGDVIEFVLDPDCTGAGKSVLREAMGFWFVEPTPGRPGYSRIWMSARVHVSSFVPGFIVDYAAARALPRASVWLKPTCEAAQRRKERDQRRAAVAAAAMPAGRAAGGGDAA
ncbi:unnamed protein product [Phaeothamnion confervicola]